ncbi:sodium-dependent bicarbonate transport family permease [Aliikangiella marina]|uniref:Sodium-dependent bicarbonate transport family permease n=1 Tax=Aliikangiella marina TaxID=1712262 RepID=A0A545TJN6_9GAMM|nr:sodium-dependent bicarbonate transport family permease [Aliikangiella marina]TQV77417.1 sodium-dependent bicarbonate transport family permease [Aliikangiella marina]
MQIDVIVLFFLLGFVAKLIGSNLRFPDGFHHSISIFLMLAIGIKGGIALSENFSTSILIQAGLFTLLGLALPFMAYPVLKLVGGFEKKDSAAIAAHFGSVSIGTYAVAVALLESQNVAYEAYFPLFVVLLEFPAMFIAVFLAKEAGGKLQLGELSQQILKNESIVLLFGGLLIGFVAQAQAVKLMPLFNDMFYGVLALFLLAMGIDAADKVKLLKQNSVFLIAFGTLTPVINGLVGGVFGYLLGFSVGGIFLTIVLSASASYIAVPIAMRTLLPDANHSFGMTTSLGITFPFNILAGMPVYWLFAHWLSKIA